MVSQASAYFRRYLSFRVWLRNALRSAVHAGTGAILSTLGTNGAETLAPQILQGVGLDLKQAIGVFSVAAVVNILHRVHQSTNEPQPEPSAP